MLRCGHDLRGRLLDLHCAFRVYIVLSFILASDNIGRHHSRRCGLLVPIYVRLYNGLFVPVFDFV